MLKMGKGGHRLLKHEVKGSTDPTPLLEIGIKQCCLTPHFFQDRLTSIFSVEFVVLVGSSAPASIERSDMCHK